MTTSWLRDSLLKQRSKSQKNHPPNLSNSVRTFKSYVDLEGNEAATHSSEDNQLQEKDHCEDKSFLSASLLPGEVIIAEAENVLKFNTLSEFNKGISGALVCTNFKLSFLTAENFPSNLHQRNAFLGEHDICLINIDSIYHVVGGKRKKLTSSCVSWDIEILEIHCKDFRIYTFSFKFSPVKQRSVIKALIHHAFVPRINLLFAFDYQEKFYTEESSNHSLLFTQAGDWEAELERCKCSGWRVSLANEKFFLCESLPECFVVPSILLDMNLNKTAPHFLGHRVPTWSWGLPTGASIVRMAALGVSDSQEKDIMIDAISRASPRQLPVRLFDADELCPSYKEVQSSYLKLKELCMPNSAQDFWETDSHYLSNLESTKWLHYVSACLTVALEAANNLTARTTVVFSEHEGRDTSAILSSLVQILLDPFYRTITGFQRLIQKEWVALGHPFTERHHLISGCEGEESPIFLLFLDCVWQLTQQCPAVFEFSETYLTTVWDSCRISVFDTFLFSSHKNRVEAYFLYNPSKLFQLRSIWKWSKQFSKNDLRLFFNPLYILNQYRKPPHYQRSLSENDRPKSLSSLRETTESRRDSIPTKESEAPAINWCEHEENLMKIDPNISSLSLWHQCYLRWVPLANILGGGPPILFLMNMKNAEEIKALEKKIESEKQKHKTKNPSLRHRRAASDDYTISADIIDNCQIPEGSSIVTSVFPFSPVAPWDWSSYHFVPSTSCLQISYSESEEALDD